MDLGSLDPHVRFEVRRDKIVNVLVWIVRFDHVLFSHLKHDVGLTNLPAPSDELWHFREILGIAFLGALVHPGGYSVDVLLSQSVIVGEFTVSGIRTPRRHLAIDDLLFDRASPG